MYSISLTKSQVPQFLIGSEFYNSLNLRRSERFSIPRIHFKTDPIVENPDDLSHLLQTIQFWGVRKLPNELIEFLLKESTSEDYEPICNILSGFDDAFHLHAFFQDFQKATSLKMRVDAAVKSARKDVVEYVVSYERQPSLHVVKHAAEFGLLYLLQTARAHLRATASDPFVQVSLRKVASGGHTECLQFLLTNGCKKDSLVCLGAAESGHLDCLVMARSFDCTWNSRVTTAAAHHGHTSCLEYAMQGGCPVVFEAAHQAALHGRTDCLQLLISAHPEMLSARLTSAAAGGGYLDCLTFLHEVGCPWAMHGTRMAAWHGRLECLKYAISKGCPLSSNAANVATERGHEECLRFLLGKCKLRVDDERMVIAVRRGHVACVRLLRQHGVTPQLKPILRAICEINDENYVRVLVEAGYAMEPHLVTAAVQACNNRCLAYLCSLDETALVAEEMADAAGLGNLGALEILHQCDCPWDASACCAAAAAGHAACLQFLHEHGCPWDASVSRAAKSGPVLSYCVENGCPIDESVMKKYNEWRVERLQG